LSGRHGYECYVYEMIRVTFTLTSVNSSMSAMMFTPQIVKTENLSISPMDLRKSLTASCTVTG